MKTLATIFSFALIGSVTWQSSCSAQEWTRFRGPNGSGIGQAVSIPVTWNAEDYNWKIELPGRGHSSPVLWGKRLFLLCGDEQNGKRTVLCLDADNGKQLWSRDFDAETHRKHRKNSYATSTPAVDANHVYVCWGVPAKLTMLALDHDGAVVWEADLGRFKGGHGFGASPIVVESLVVLGNDQDGKSSLLALDCKTGKVRWSRPRKSLRATYSTPCLYRPKGRMAELIFTNWQHGITSVNPLDGSLNWETHVFGKTKERAIGSPVIAGDLVIGSCGFVTSDKHLVAVRPYATAEDDMATEIYRIERAVPHIPTALVKDDLLFLWSDKGIVTCVEAASGKRIWQKRVGGNFFASPVFVDGSLYNFSADGEAVVLAASRKYELLGRVSLGEPCFSTPAVALDKMFLRTTKHLMSLGGRK